MNQDYKPKAYDDYEWNGPRPPVPGKESRRPKVKYHPANHYFKIENSIYKEYFVTFNNIF